MKAAHLSRLDLNLLKVFAAVHRERHITRAGRALFISQSAVSHSIAKLRTLFDDQLFIRTPDGMQPTVLADRLAEPIRRALQSISDAMQVTQRFDPAVAEVEFSIGMTTLQPFHFLPDFYRRLEREAPGVNLLLRTLQGGWNESLQALDNGEIDMLLTVTDRGDDRALEPQRFISEDLFDDPLVCVVSKQNDQVGATMDFDTYANLPHLVMASSRVTRTWIDDVLARRGLQRRIAVVAPHPYAIPVLTSGTRLVSTVARSLVASLVQHADLRMLAPPFSGTNHVFQMIWSARTDGDLALAWIRNLVRDSCREAESKLATPTKATAKRTKRARSRRSR
jgi:DNA-binding transcriptional LysR family regulator